ncbi:serine/threonine-protein kinase pim-2-like [Carassius auratus]|uniref:non-specific serine/threonine protein kinase n=1 Tax=Carassius auratus TaxID=7957 RepID=A0A6P6MC73_CARAU|nr:serine/threonine-protein kinase pim-2-like [Carassius auratus]
MSTTTERSGSESVPVARAAWASKASSFERIDMSKEKNDNSPADKGKKGKAVHVFFHKLCASVKRPDRVLRLPAQTDAHLDDPEVMAVPGPSTIPDLLCLPGQVCADPEHSSGIREPKLHPDPFALSLCHKEAKKGRKRKAVRAFFRRACKAVKQLFSCCDSERVQPPKAEPDLDPSQLVLPEQDQDSADLQSSPEEEGPSEIQAQDEDLSGPESGSESGPVTGSWSIVSETGSVSIVSEMDTVLPDPEIELAQGSFVSLFEVGHLIASGNFSKVYEGTHAFSDKVKVALKCIPKRRADRYLDVPGHSKPLLAEVALMLRLGEAPSCLNILELHQWLEDESSFTLILEYPEPCRTLEDYILFSGPFSEAQAHLFMLQVLKAVKHCHERGVYHGDIRSRNILVTLYSLELKLFNFRCARLINSEGFDSSQYQGSDAYTPPEVLGLSMFHAAAADVWVLAVLLFEIIHRYLPFESFDAILHGYLRMDPTLSTACCDLIFHCLSRNPSHRLTLQQLEEHRWMKT